VAYQYDDLPGGSAADYPGQRTKITYPDGKYVDYTYLADGRMSSVTDWLTKQTTYEYGDAGALTKKTYPNGTCTTYGYDYGGDRLIAVTNRRMAAPPTCSPSDTVISALSYIYDAVGNRTAMGDLAGNQGYVYDTLHELKQAQYADPQTDSYTYDANGNRLAKNATNYAYDAADRMTCTWSGSSTPSCPTGSLNYGYDNNGNQTSRGTDTFTYDHENRLTQTVIGGVTSSSIYDGDGQRMSHTVSGQTTNYAWDAGAKLPVVLQDGTNTYVYGLDLISATDSSGAQTYVLHDSLGSTTDLLDGTGNGVATYGYDIFGAIRSQTGSSPNQWLFTGEQRDGDSSLYFLRARYYDPVTGRFLSQDPAQAGQPYAYANSNPVNLIDPSGLFACKDLPFISEEECQKLNNKYKKIKSDVNEELAGINEDVIQPAKELLEEHGLEALKQCAIWGVGGFVSAGWWGAAGGCAAGAGGVIAEAIWGPNAYSQCIAWGGAGLIASKGNLVVGGIGCATGVAGHYFPDSPAVQCGVWLVGSFAGAKTNQFMNNLPPSGVRSGVAGCMSGALSVAEPSIGYSP
jgi:RHS repeat-associated protein